MDEKLASAMVTITFLIGGFVTAAIVTIILLVVSIFHEVDLLTAFALQFLAGFIGGLVVIWRAS
ncbi:hypothetical protein ACQZ5D_03580 [Agrobacterium sp. 22-211-1]